METYSSQISFFLFLCLPSAALLKCTAEGRSGTRVTIQENTFANFSLPLTARTHKTFGNFSRLILIKLCDNGTQNSVCKCRWRSDNHVLCKNESDLSACDVDSSELRFSLLVRRTHTYVIWEIFENNSLSQGLVKYTELQVTYPPTINSLLVNGEQVNETYFISDGENPDVYCSYSNGNPPARLELSDDRGRIHRQSNGQGHHLASKLGVVHCHDTWPTVRCEAGASELNRSVMILVRCPPQFSDVSGDTFDLSRIKDGLKINIRSHTANIPECWMRGMSSEQTDRVPISCDTSGTPPYLALTLHFRAESLNREGNWILFVRNEVGISNMTFALRNTSVPQSQKSSNSTNQAWTMIVVISLGSVLGFVLSAALTGLVCKKLITTHKLGPDLNRSLRMSPGAADQDGFCDAENENTENIVAACSVDHTSATDSQHRNADGLTYGQLEFSDSVSCEIIMGCAPKTKYADISFTLSRASSE